jgi:hypothetical protein
VGLLHIELPDLRQMPHVQMRCAGEHQSMNKLHMPKWRKPMSVTATTSPGRINMRKRTLLGTTFALAALSASIAGITAGTASALPREGTCAGSAQAMEDSLDMALAASAQGDYAASDDWMKTYYTAERFYSTNC